MEQCGFDGDDWTDAGALGAVADLPGGWTSAVSALTSHDAGRWGSSSAQWLQAMKVDPPNTPTQSTVVVLAASDRQRQLVAEP